MKWSKVKPDGFNHGFRELVTELIMNKMSEKVTFTASSALCKIDEVPVFVTESFINESKGDYLVHGVEIFRNLYGDDKKIDAIQKYRRLQREFYTLERITNTLKSHYKEYHSELLEGFYKMVLVDAWLGNQDRHAENWGVIERKNGRGGQVSFAPLFDTSRGLFWNHTIVNLWMNFMWKRGEAQRLKYIQKSRPLISLEKNKNANHFEVAAAIKKVSPELFRNVLNSLNES